VGDVLLLLWSRGVMERWHEEPRFKISRVPSLMHDNITDKVPSPGVYETAIAVFRAKGELNWLSSAHRMNHPRWNTP
ncbi:MAG: hypothetical protein ACRDCA_24895, partial [Serratia sp. (in: enterobacteria)]|uniref:hypothetical protein n=1 Tax=Serratia sp. (in: enterobacteria) TaxID=616 RepID=UPI003F335DAC